MGEKGNKKNIALKVIIAILTIIVIITICAIGIGTWYINDKLSKIQTVEIAKDEIEITQGVEEELTGYRTIALLGIDSRQDTYSEGNRSDCIILASISNKTKEVRLVSVYRDTYLDITGRYLDKVTHAYSFGGPALALSTLNTNLDLDITEFVTVNFEAVKDIVGSLGGVNIDITDEEVPFITGIDSAGNYTLNGEQALSYSRIRYATGGDYKRTERMRTVLSKCFDKAKTKNLSELNDLANKLLPRVYTNIDSKEIISLIPNLASYKITESTGWPPKVEGKIINKVWYGVPVNLEESVKVLHQELFDDTEYEPSDKVKEISNKIINKTGVGN